MHIARVSKYIICSYNVHDVYLHIIRIIKNSQFIVINDIV